VSNSAVMNRMFVEAASRGERPAAGMFARLTGSPDRNVQPDTDTRQERLNAAFADRELAMEAGDADALAFTEHRIDRIVDEARAARKPAEPDQGAPQPAAFDGGFRGRRSFQPRSGSEPTATQLLQLAMIASRAQRAQREADPGQTIIANI
jgi:hypothetical protein